VKHVYRVSKLGNVDDSKCSAPTDPYLHRAVPDSPKGFPVERLVAGLHHPQLESCVDAGVGRKRPEVDPRPSVLVPGVGTRVELPKNRVGIDGVIVMLGASGESVWLAQCMRLLAETRVSTTSLKDRLSRALVNPLGAEASST